jgi:SAM-dependent methyltransferase
MFGKFGGSTAIHLDPFGFWPGASTRIVDTGGETEAPDPEGVFHTVYLSFDPGPVAIDIMFDRLTATRGQMRLQALARYDDDRVPPAAQSATVVDLAELAATGGRHHLAVIARPDCSYAFTAHLLGGDTDARAQGLTILASQPAEGKAFARKLAGAKRLFAPRRDTTGLVVDEPATLAEVRSQMCTAAQFDEPDYDRWIGAMHRPKHQHRKQWEHVWICRALEVAGVLHDGARGLGFGCGIEPLPAVFAARGVEVLATDLGADDRRSRRWQQTAQHLLDIYALNHPAICLPGTFFSKVKVAAVDMNRIPPELLGYDFCWSSCSLEHLGSLDAGLRFIERSLETLKPGGVAVHTTELNLSSDTRTIRKGGTVLFRRSDIEAFAYRMREAGHEVFPITWDQGSQPVDQIVDVPPYAADLHFKLALRRYVTTSFGLAIRKRR